MVESKADRPLLIYVAAAALVALAVGVAVARGLGRSEAVATVPSPVAPAVVEDVVLPEPVTEADLRADLLPTSAGEMAVIFQAERFVADYFTVDNAGDRQAILEDVLGWSPPVVPTGRTTYVEWARAWEAIDLGGGEYRVLVAYREISDLEEGFSRGPVRGVAVSVQLGIDGGSRVLDLPEPVAIPPGPEIPRVPEVDTLPASVTEAAREQARSWGSNPSIMGGSELEDAWRVVVDIRVASGRWPLVVRVPK